MSKLSIQVENQISISNKVVASAKAHAGTAAAALATRAAENEAAEDKAGDGKAAKNKAAKNKAAKKAEEKEQPITAESCEAFVLFLAASLERATQDLAARELEYTAEQADDGPVREARDAKVKQAVGILTRLRSTVEDTLGVAALRTYGLQSETPRVPRAVQGHLKNVASLLKKTPASAKTEFGAAFETAAAAAALEKLNVELTALIGDDDREARELEDALAKRNRAMGAWSTTYQGVATTLEGLYRLAGWGELADRVRPTQRALRGEDAGEAIEEAPGEGGSGNGGTTDG
jgi:hypothetical protein